MTEEAINAIETRHRQLPISCNDVPALVTALRDAQWVITNLNEQVRYMREHLAEAHAEIDKLLQRKPHVGVKKEQSHGNL